VVVWQADYDPFGKATVNDDPDGNGIHVTNNIRFPGQYYDNETGLHYNYHRYYDPGIGRMASPDPVIGTPEQPQSYNLYPYVGNQPVNRIDPKGLNWHGNWCGPGGSGPATDCYDAACKRHDQCYQDCGVNWLTKWLPFFDLHGSSCAWVCDAELTKKWKKCACSHGASGSW